MHPRMDAAFEEMYALAESFYPDAVTGADAGGDGLGAFWTGRQSEGRVQRRDTSAAERAHLGERMVFTADVPDVNLLVRLDHQIWRVKPPGWMPESRRRQKGGKLGKRDLPVKILRADDTQSYGIEAGWIALVQYPDVLRGRAAHPHRPEGNQQGESHAHALHLAPPWRSCAQKQWAASSAILRARGAPVCQDAAASCCGRPHERRFFPHSSRPA